MWTKQKMEDNEYTIQKRMVGHINLKKQNKTNKKGRSSLALKTLENKYQAGHDRISAQRQ